jgi:radical SAM superfamily enzyme YgiQ (UPF0313 family)
MMIFNGWYELISACGGEAMQSKTPGFFPPVEADSLYLKVTTGCSYNRCSFCGTYRETPFEVRNYEDIEAEVKKVVKRYRDEVCRVFLGEGDALVAETKLLKKLLGLFNKSFPNLQHVGIYATPKNLLDKSKKELEALAAEGLQNIYMGLESGSDKILEKLEKGVTAEEFLKAARKASDAGIRLSTMAILGAGGRKDWREHATATGQLLSRIDPHTIIILTLVLVPDTPLFEEARRGNFTPPTPVESVLELKELITSIDVSGALFKSNHVSNFLKLNGHLPKDKEKMLHQLERVLNNPTEEFFDPGYFRG